MIIDTNSLLFYNSLGRTTMISSSSSAADDSLEWHGTPPTYVAQDPPAARANSSSTSPVVLPTNPDYAGSRSTAGTANAIVPHSIQQHDDDNVIMGDEGQHRKRQIDDTTHVDATSKKLMIPQELFFSLSSPAPLVQHGPPPLPDDDDFSIDEMMPNIS